MKNKKRLWLGMAAAFLSALLVAATFEGKLPMVKADEVTVVAEGICGSDKNGTATVTYRLESDGKMTLSGYGSMDWYAYKYVPENGWDEPPWAGYRDSIRELVVEEGVFSIGTEAFKDCENLQKVSLPESLERIWDEAFAESGVRQVSLPSGLEKVEEGAFRDCTSLTGLEMGSDIQKVGKEAFRGCISLRRVYLPSTDAWWGKYAFAGCSNLERAEFAEGFTFKPYWMEDGYKYNTEVYGIDSGCAMFYNCKRLKEVILPESLSELPTGFFWGCKSLPKEYVLRGSAVWSTCVPDMGEEEFTLPSYVTKVARRSMAGNESVRKLTVPENVELIDRWAFAFDETVEEVVLPRHVAWDTSFAFAHDKKLKKVTLPEGITELGEEMFSSCTSLESFEVPEGVRKISNAFLNCTELKEIKLPQSVESLDGTFDNCKSLKEINIPKGVTELGTYTFEGCKLLKEVKIPKGVTKLEDYAFADCVSLEKINLPKGLIKLGKDNRFKKGAVFKNCKSLKEIRLPGKLTAIERKTFMGCRKLKTVYIESKKIKSVGYDAFKGIHKNACIYVPKGKMKKYKELMKESGAKMKHWTWKYL